MKKHIITMPSLTGLSFLLAITVTQGQVNLGTHNTIGAGPYSSVTGGDYHANNAASSTIGGGEQNTISLYADYSFVGGGALNSVAGPVSFIGGGEGNSIDSSSTWGVIAGGSYNELFSLYSAIGGGLQNYIGSGNDYSVIGGGYANSATASDYVTIGGGVANIIKNSANYSTIGGGYWNTNTAANTTIAGGAQNSADGAYSSVPGGKGAVARLYGQTAQASGYFSQPGDAQASTYILRGITTDNTTTELFLDGSGQRLTIPVGAAFTCNIQIVYRSTSKREGYLSDFIETFAYIENEAGTVRGQGGARYAYQGGGGVFYNTPQTPEFSVQRRNDSYSVSISADDTNDSLKITVNGANGHTVRWVAVVRTAEVIMP